MVSLSADKHMTCRVWMDCSQYKFSHVICCGQVAEYGSVPPASWLNATWHCQMRPSRTYLCKHFPLLQVCSFSWLDKFHKITVNSVLFSEMLAGTFSVKFVVEWDCCLFIDVYAAYFSASMLLVWQRERHATRENCCSSSRSFFLG